MHIEWDADSLAWGVIERWAERVRNAKCESQCFDCLPQYTGLDRRKESNYVCCFKRTVWIWIFISRVIFHPWGLIYIEITALLMTSQQSQPLAWTSSMTIAKSSILSKVQSGCVASCPATPIMADSLLIQTALSPILWALRNQSACLDHDQQERRENR